MGWAVRRLNPDWGNTFFSSPIPCRLVVLLMDIVVVLLMDTAFFCRNVLCTVCKSQAYFLVLSSRLSVNHTIYLHYYFLASRAGMGRREFPSISFCGRTKYSSREQCVG
jgi:hypothetical protein